MIHPALPEIKETVCETEHSCAPLNVIGRSAFRPDAPGKLTGQAKYVNDMAVHNMLYGAVVRSRYAKARIKNIDTSKAEKMSGVVCVMSSKDLPGPNYIPLVRCDLPLLAADEVNFAAQPVALVAAETLEEAQAAAAAVEVEYEELEPVLSIDEGLEKNWILWHYQQFKGDVDSIFNNPEPGMHIYESVYTTSHQEHAYLETNGALVMPDDRSGWVVYGSMQCPFYVQKAVAVVLGIDFQKVRVIQTVTGGGFGGKEDAPSTPASLAAVLSWKTGRPVKLVFGREEDMESMTKRHPSRTVFKSAVDKNGRIKAVDIHYYVDGGAYLTLSSIVLWRGMLHAGGPYNIPNLRTLADAVGSNTAPNGAFRGFGQPQVVFAADAHWDDVACQIGMDPIEFRRINMLHVGDKLTSGQLLVESVGFDEVVDKVKQVVEYDKIKALPKCKQDRFQRGIGFSVSHYGVGLGANGGPNNFSSANVVVGSDGSVRVAVGTTEIGQGMTTVLLQIASEVLCCPYDRIYLSDSDTAQVPDSGPTVASRTTLCAGRAVQDACRQIRQRMDDFLKDKEAMDWKDSVTACWIGGVQMAAQGYSRPGYKQTFEDQYGQGDAYEVYTWCANAADVTVDTWTGEVKINRFVSGQDIGRALNPALVEGQIQGGALQGIGYTLMEEYKFDKGRILNNNLSTYILPTSTDVPEIVPVIVEHNYSWGPFGAKGFGETPLVPVAPAIINAIADAVNIRLKHLPATPERVWEALHNSGVSQL
ncbi:MAG: xanthine dehydrogenase family protein molybdopterin-binding subunit [Candidatus Bruticola sp.]